ncbi:MAG: hypothetical protein ACREJB_06505 [Planctomycetaceae bacterium]
MKTHEPAASSFALCVKNDGYEVDLDVGTVYLILPDEKAAKRGRIRVVDESGEDYLYPHDYFQPVQLSQFARKAVSVA